MKNISNLELTKVSRRIVPLYITYSFNIYSLICLFITSIHLFTYLSICLLYLFI